MHARTRIAPRTDAATHAMAERTMNASDLKYPHLPFTHCLLCPGWFSHISCRVIERDERRLAQGKRQCCESREAFYCGVIGVDSFGFESRIEHLGPTFDATQRTMFHATKGSDTVQRRAENSTAATPMVKANSTLCTNPSMVYQRNDDVKGL